MKSPTPLIGNWYKDIQQGTIFEVVAYDERAKTIEAQLIDGEVCEYDLENWRHLPLESIDGPEDWRSGYSLSEEDGIDTDLPYRPDDFSNPLNRIETDIINGLIDDIDFY